MSNIETLAQQLVDALESKKRENGESFLCLKDGSPGWMTDAVREAHDNGEQLSNDQRYRFIHDAAVILAELGDSDEPEEALDTDVDVYISDLTGWLDSTPSRVYWLTEALENGEFKDGAQLLRTAQYMERREVYDQLLSALQSLATEKEEENA